MFWDRNLVMKVECHDMIFFFFFCEKASLLNPVIFSHLYAAENYNRART